MVAELTAAVPVLAERLDRFVRERLLKNLLATSPLFKPFDNQQQMELARGFEGIDVERRTASSGRTKWAGPLPHPARRGRGALATGRPVAGLRAGDLFGEMALLDDSPTTAAVRAVGPTSILFLGRDYFRRLVSALPALGEFFEDLSRSRSASNI